MKTKHGKARRTTAPTRAPAKRPVPRAPQPGEAPLVVRVERPAARRGLGRRVPAGVGGRVDRAARAGRRVSSVRGLDDLVVRLGLAFVFTYASLAAFAEPDKFEQYIPSALAHPWVAHWCLPVFSTLELVLAAALATGRRLVLASTLAAVTVAGITLSNPSHFDVLFRNVAIVCAALSLAIRSRERAQSPATVIVLPD